jgi:NADP-dependent 3-hydroxy acid dehydrogenase YdfG
MHNERLSLASKVAMITGASSGLGEHFARVLAAAGASVVVAARRLDLLQTIADEITSGGRRALAVAMDVTSVDAVRSAVDMVEREFGSIDVLVNNSGVVTRGHAIDIEEKDWDVVIDTNLKGALLVSQQVAKRMIARRQEGCIVNIAGAGTGQRSNSGKRHRTRVFPHGIKSCVFRNERRKGSD